MWYSNAQWTGRMQRNDGKNGRQRLAQVDFSGIVQNGTEGKKIYEIDEPIVWTTTGWIAGVQRLACTFSSIFRYIIFILSLLGLLSSFLLLIVVLFWHIYELRNGSSVKLVGFFVTGNTLHRLFDQVKFDESISIFNVISSEGGYEGRILRCNMTYETLAWSFKWWPIHLELVDCRFFSLYWFVVTHSHSFSVSKGSRAPKKKTTTYRMAANERNILIRLTMYFFSSSISITDICHWHNIRLTIWHFSRILS